MRQENTLGTGDKRISELEYDKKSAHDDKWYNAKVALATLSSVDGGQDIGNGKSSHGTEGLGG